MKHRPRAFPAEQIHGHHPIRRHPGFAYPFSCGMNVYSVSPAMLLHQTRTGVKSRKNNLWLFQAEGSGLSPAAPIISSLSSSHRRTDPHSQFQLVLQRIDDDAALLGDLYQLFELLALGIVR